MGNRSNYWQKWREEPTDQDIYDDIRRSLREDDDEEDEEYSSKHSGYSRGSSSNNERSGGNSSSNFHNNPDEKLRRLAATYQRIEDFFLALGEDINTYFNNPSEQQPKAQQQPYVRRR